MRETDSRLERGALWKAVETGQTVTISRRSTFRCSDPSKECNVDIIRRVATPEGEIEERRTHTY